MIGVRENLDKALWVAHQQSTHRVIPVMVGSAVLQGASQVRRPGRA